MEKDFSNFMKDLNGISYLQYHLTYLISPVLTGAKPSSLIGIGNDVRQLLDLWKKDGESLVSSLNLKAITLRRIKERDIILIYSEEKLLEVVNMNGNSNFLKNFGYMNLNSLNETLKHLCERYNTYHCPHEIGIFLGIPRSDVEAFMKCDSNKCLMCGYWKIFSDVEKAKRLFKMYDWSKEIVMTYALEGRRVNWIASTLRNTFFYVN